MKKNIFSAVMLLSLTASGFVACSNDDVVKGGATEGQKASTFMTVSFSVGEQTRSEDYNYLGKFYGQDKVNSVRVYIYNGTTGAFENTYLLTSADLTQTTTSTNELIFRPSKAFQTTAGPKKVYVVVNNNAQTDLLLGGLSNAAAFEAAYQSDALATLGDGGATAAATATGYTANPVTAASTLATLDKTGGSTPTDWKDVIVMTQDVTATGQNGVVTVEDGVTETTAHTGYNATGATEMTAKNHVVLDVKRTVARVVATTTAPSFDLTGDQPFYETINRGGVAYAPGATGFKLGTLSDFTYVTAQSERKLYLQQKRATPAVPTSATATYTSPANGMTATGANYAIASSTFADAYDYANLWKKGAGATLAGVPVATMAALTGTTTALKQADAETIGKLMSADYVLPTTQGWGNTAATTKYQEANTAYIFVRAIFKPTYVIRASATAAAQVDYITAATRDQIAQDDYDVIKTQPATYRHPATDFSTLSDAQKPKYLFYGSVTKRFYSTYYASQEPRLQGSAGQGVRLFRQAIDPATNAVLGYEMFYFAPVNPDTNNGYTWLNSPVYRNNIYHMEISGVTALGSDNNPLVPVVPNNPSDPTDMTYDPTTGVTTTPGNPNGKPELPVYPTWPNDPSDPTPDPPTPPTPTPDPTPDPDPADHISTPKTYLSVSARVLPWLVHSYKFSLGNR